MVGFVEAEEGGFGAVGSLAVVGYFQPQNLSVELEGPFKVGHQDSYMAYTLDVYSHNSTLLN